MKALRVPVLAFVIPVFISLGALGARVQSRTVSTVDALDSRLSIINGVTMLDGKPYMGLTKELYANGRVKRLAEYGNGRLDGPVFGWNPDGTRSYLRMYRRGLESGLHTGWHSNGQPRFRFVYSKGNLEGAGSEWYANGQLFTELHYYRGQEKGSQRMWTGEGKLRANYVVADGRRFGLMGSMGCRSPQRVASQ